MNKNAFSNHKIH